MSISSSVSNDHDSSVDGNLMSDHISVPLDSIVTMSLRCMEIILRDRKYQTIVSMKPDFIRDVLNLLHNMASTEQRRHAICIIYNIGRINASKIHIGKHEGFKKMLFLLEKDNDAILTKEILRTVRHFVYSRRGMSGVLELLKDETKDHDELDTAPMTTQKHQHQHQHEHEQQQQSEQPFLKNMFSKIFPKKPNNSENTDPVLTANNEHDTTGQSLFQYFPPQKKEIASAIERITTSLEEQSRMQDTQTMTDEAVDPIVHTGTDSPGSSRKACDDTLRELIIRQNVIPTLTQALKNNSFELQLDIATTISRLVFHNHRNQEEMRRIDGYSVFLKMLNFSTDFTSSESRDFLQKCFDMIYVIILDGKQDHEIGNLEALKILMQLVMSDRYEVQHHAIRSMLDLLAANAVNAVYINYISGEDTFFDALVRCGQQQELQRQLHRTSSLIGEEPGYDIRGLDTARQVSERLTMSQRQNVMRFLIQLLSYQYAILSNYHQDILIRFASCLNSPECTHEVKMLCLQTICKILGDIKIRQQDVDKTFLTKLIKCALSVVKSVTDELNHNHASQSNGSDIGLPLNECKQSRHKKQDSQDDQPVSKSPHTPTAQSQNVSINQFQCAGNLSHLPLDMLRLIMESLLLLDKNSENVLLFQQMGLLDLIQGLVQESVPYSIVSLCLDLFKDAYSAFPYLFEPTLIIGMIQRNISSPKLLCHVLIMVHSMFLSMRSIHRDHARVCKIQFRDYGGIDIILKLLQSYTDEVVYCAIYLLSELYCDCCENKNFVTQKLGSQGFLNLLVSRNVPLLEVTSDTIDMAFELATSDSFIERNSRKQHYLPRDVLIDFLDRPFPRERLTRVGLLFQRPLVSSRSNPKNSISKSTSHKRTMSLNKRSSEFRSKDKRITPLQSSASSSIGSEEKDTDKLHHTANKQYHRVSHLSRRSKKTLSFDDSNVLERLLNNEGTGDNRLSHFPSLNATSLTVQKSGKISQVPSPTPSQTSSSRSATFFHRRVRSVQFHFPLNQLSNVIFWNCNFASMVVDLIEVTTSQILREGIVETILHLLRANPLNTMFFCQAVQSTANNSLLRLVRLILLNTTGTKGSNCFTLCVDLISTVYSYSMRHSDMDSVMQEIHRCLATEDGTHVSHNQCLRHMMIEAMVATFENVHPNSYIHFNGIDSTMHIGSSEKVPNGGYTLAFWMNCCSISYKEATLMSLHDRANGSILRLFVRKACANHLASSPMPSPPSSSHSFTFPTRSTTNGTSVDLYTLCFSICSPQDWISMRDCNPSPAVAREVHECKNLLFSMGQWYHIAVQHNPRDGVILYVNGYRSHAFSWSHIPKNTQAQQSKGIEFTLGSMFHPSVNWSTSSGRESNFERAMSPRSSYSSSTISVNPNTMVTNIESSSSINPDSVQSISLNVSQALHADNFHGSISTLYVLRGKYDDSFIAKWYHSDGAVLSYGTAHQIPESKQLLVVHPEFELVSHLFGKHNPALVKQICKTSATLSSQSNNCSSGTGPGEQIAAETISASSNAIDGWNNMGLITSEAHFRKSDYVDRATSVNPHRTYNFSVGISGKLVKRKRKQGPHAFVEASGGVTSHTTSALNAFANTDAQCKDNVSCNRSLFLALEMLHLAENLGSTSDFLFMFDSALRILISAVTVCNSSMSRFEKCNGYNLLVRILSHKNQHITLDLFKQLMVLSSLGHRSGKDLIFTDRKGLQLLLEMIKICPPATQNQCLKLLSHSLLAVSENMRFWKTEGPGVSGMLELCHTIVRIGVSDDNTNKTGANKDNSEALAIVLNIVEQMFTEGNSDDVNTLLEFTFSLMEHSASQLRSHNIHWHLKTKDLLLGMVYNMMKLSPSFADQLCSPTQHFYLFFSLLSSPSEDIRVKGLKIVSLFLHNNTKVSAG